MNPIKVFLTALLSFAGLIGSANISCAAADGTDDASQPAYQPNWPIDSNGEATGDAFLPWSMTSGTGSAGFAGFFLGDSTTLNDPGADINVSGDSWGLFANGDPAAAAYAQRSFTADGSTVFALDVDQTFSINIAVNYRNGEKGFNLLDASNDTLFTLQIGDDAYTVYDAATGDGTLPDQTYDSDTAFALSFTQTTAGSGTWTVTRTGGQTDFASGTYDGDAAGFRLYIQDTGNTASDNLYANSLVIASVPEPSPMGLIACGTGALVLLRWRRR